MRLVLVLDRFEPDRGGLENWAWQWTRWLLARGHRVDVVASEFQHVGRLDGLTLHSLGFAASRYEFAARVAGFLDDLPVDLVHDLGVGWRYDLLQPHFGTRLADDRRNLRTLSLPRRISARLSNQRRQRLHDIRNLERRQYVGNEGHIVVTSGMTRDDIMREHGRSASGMSLIPNGVDTAHFRPVDEAVRRAARERACVGDDIVLLFAAHNFRLKGLGTVLRALARLRSPSLRLIVVGRGEIGKYTALAERYGLAGRVAFTGFEPDIRTQFALADIFIHPSFYDPCSLTTFEAAASGLPVLTSRFNGASEIFSDRVSAHIVSDPEDAGELAGRIRLLLDPEERARIAAAGHAVAVETTTERAFSQLFSLCAELQRKGRVT